MKDIDKGVPTSIEVKCKKCKYKIQIRSTNLKKTSKSSKRRKKEPYHRYQCPRCGRKDKISYYVISQELLKELFNRKS